MVSEGVCNFRGEWISKVHTLQSRLSSIISHKFSNHSSIFVNLWLSKVGVVFVSDCWFHALQKTMLFEGCLIFGDVFVFSLQKSPQLLLLLQLKFQPLPFFTSARFGD